MENILLNYIEQFKINEFLSYFSCELFLILGIVLNLFFLVFYKRKLNIKRISDFITCGVFSLNTIILSVFFIKDYFLFQEYEFSIWNNLVIFNNNSITTKLLINIFMLLFVLVTYKLIRKARFKAPLTNSTLLLITFFSCEITQVSNFLALFILLDLISILIYKYASNMRIRKIRVYSGDFIILGFSSTVLFFSFYILSFFIHNPIQLSIVQVCVALSCLLKFGIFPLYNYSINKNYKTNLPYTILLFCFYPWISVYSYGKMIAYMNYSNEIYQISLLAFLSLTLIYFGFFALKQKNIVKFLINANLCFAIYALINITTLSTNADIIGFISKTSFIFLALYSMLCVLKINLKKEKINILSIKGIAHKNRLFAFIFSVLLLTISCVIPSGLLISGLKLLSEVYIYDKLTFIISTICVISIMFILLNSLKIIRNMYSFSFKNLKDKLTKKITLNYVISFIIFSILIVDLFL